MCVIHCSVYSVVDIVVYMIVCMFIDVLVCMNMYKCICNGVHVCVCVQVRAVALCNPVVVSVTVLHYVCLCRLALRARALWMCRELSAETML